MSIPDIRAPFFRQSWWRVKNATGSIIPPHSVVLRNGTIDTSEGEPIFSVIQPNSSSTQFNWAGYLVTGPDPIGASSSAQGWATNLWEPGFVRYAGSSPTAGTVYGPKHGQLTLEANYYGFLILGGATTASGNNVAVAQWIGVHSIIGTVNSASVSTGNTIGVSVHVGTTYQTDSGMDVTALNRATDLTGLSSNYCEVTIGNGIPILSWVAC